MAHMARTRTRTWDETTELARVVATIGGIRWAAAIADTSEETLVQALQRGYLRDSRMMRVLAEKAVEKGMDVDLWRMLGSTDPTPPPRGGRRGRRHYGRAGRTSTSSADPQHAAPVAAVLTHPTVTALDEAA